MHFQQHPNHIFTLSDFLLAEECQSFIEKGEANGFEEARVNTFGGQKLLKSVRNNDRCLYKDIALSDKLFKRARSHIPPFAGDFEACGLNELIRIYRYRPGQRFRKHADGAFTRSEDEVSALTFMIYLNADFEGGETWFRSVTIRPEAGMALVFSHHLLHEGCAVTSGTKYVLRTDVMYRRRGTDPA